MSGAVFCSGCRHYYDAAVNMLSSGLMACGKARMVIRRNHAREWSERESPSEKNANNDCADFEATPPPPLRRNWWD